MNIFRQETVSRMDGVDIADLGDRNDAVDQQIALIRLRGADADRLIGKFHGETVLIGLGIHQHRFDSHLLARADDPQCDLSPVGN